MLTTQVHPDARRLLVTGRCRAMKDGCAAGLAQLESGSDAFRDDVYSMLGLRLLKSEILYLDQQFTRSAHVFDTEVEPILQEVTPELAALIWENRSAIAFASLDFDGIDRAHHEDDIRRILEVNLRDWSDTVQAEEDARSGRHHDALPALWCQLLSAYRAQNWHARQWVQSDFGRECLALGWPDEAAWHGVQSLNEPLLASAADGLMACSDRSRLSQGIDRLVRYSQLKQHARHSAQFLGRVADCIPEDQIQSVIKWVSQFIGFVPQAWREQKLFEHVWRLVGHLASRVDSATAFRWAKMASSHEVLKKMSSWRKHLINAWDRLLERVAEGQLHQFVDPAVSLVIRDKSDLDYVDSINLLCNLAKLSNDCQSQIRDKLMPPATTISNPVLLEAAAIFGWRPQHPAKLNANAEEIAAAVRKQVEILRGDEQPAKLGGYGTVSKPIDGGRIVVHLHGMDHWVQALVSHLDLLTAESTGPFADALLTMAIDDRNLITNRVSLIQSLSKLLPRLPTDKMDAMIVPMSRIARGLFCESEVCQSYSEAKNPLNRFKINMGDPRDLRGVALLAIAEGSKINTSWSRSLHDGLLLECLEAEDEEVRCFGLAAARDCDSLTEAETSALIAGALDAVTKVRRHALDAIQYCPSLRLDERTAAIAVRSIARAASSTDRHERYLAARAARVLTRQLSAEGQGQTRLRKVLKQLEEDISFAVRRAAIEAPSAEETGV